MSFPPQPGGFSMSQPQPSYNIQSPPPPQFGNSAFGYQGAPPPWAAKLLDDMDHIKQKLHSIDKIEKTVNQISVKVSDLETQMKSLDTRLTQTEESCDFISKVHETQKNELKAAKDNLSKLQTKCHGLENDTKTMKQNQESLNAKLTDLESRSMRENFLFYGIPEGGDGEDCDALVKAFCTDQLEMRGDYVHNMIFDRAHRVGQKAGSKVRPIVVKFHYYTEREKVRQTSFNFTDKLKSSNHGVGVQLPKEIRDARKPLYSVMKKAKDEGQRVKFVGKKTLH